MKKIKQHLILILLTIFSTTIQLNAQDWTWIKGTNTIDQFGTYGTQGTSAISNTPGGRERSVSWADASGNLWLFGGSGYTTSGSPHYLNDLWKYNSSTNEWIWIKGSNTFTQLGSYGAQGTPTISNTPGARVNSVSWTDAAGNLWLFGGYGYTASASSGYLNDLWKYNPGTNEWTWIKGANTINQFGTYGTQGTSAINNTPGARYNSVSWTDAAGNLWLFGGYGYATSGSDNYLNDLWKYNPGTNEWTWIKGANISGQSGTYGTQGISAIINTPGARHLSVSWMDATGNLWLFGGTSGTVDRLNDLWKYNPNTNQWTWIKGTYSLNQLGSYGTQGTSAISNTPGSRQGSISWTDIAGNLWLFGGYGFAASGTVNVLNDLWKYNTNTNQWAWIKGANTTNQLGTYGTQGVSSINNTPGARYGSVNWVDATGNIWLFSGRGYGYASSVALGVLNDVWKYNIASVTTSLEDINDTSLSINLQPNPTNGEFVVTMLNLASASTELEIYNMHGTIVHQQSLFKNMSHVNISHLSNGLYVLKVEQNGQFKSLRLVKE